MPAPRARVLTACYYTALCVLVALCAAKVLPDLLPKTEARHIANDSEGYWLALVMSAWLQFVRPRVLGRPAAVPVTAAASLLFLVVGVYLYNADELISSVRTLNETALTLAVLLPYVMLVRRPSPKAAALGAVGMLVALVVLEHTGLQSFTTDLAEGVVMLLLAPLALDVFDRAVLRPAGADPAGPRLGWWAALVVVPLGLILLRHADLPGWLASADSYGVRAQEAFVGFFLFEVYLAAQRRLELPGKAQAAVTLPRPRTAPTLPTHSPTHEV